MLRITRAGAVKARTQAGLQLRNLIVAAPDELRDTLAGLSTKQAVQRCAQLRPAGRLDAIGATRKAMRTAARRWQQLDAEARELEADIKRLTAKAAPRLLAEPGVGPDTAAKLLTIAGDNPGWLRNDAAFAALCGTSPVEASSGKTRRHRLNRGGDRQGNTALWTIATSRMRDHPETRAYVAKRTTEGKSTREIRPLSHAPPRTPPLPPPHRRPHRPPIPPLLT